MPPRRQRWPWRLLPLLAVPLALLAAIWLPEALHDHIDRSPPSQAALAGAITEASDAVLDELSQLDLAQLHVELSPQAAAQAVADGAIDIHGLTGGRIALLGQPQDLRHGPLTYQLYMAGLQLERRLLEAWRQGGDERSLQQALQRTLALAEYERSQWHDRGFLWNDHALAMRASTLIGLWAEVRRRPALREREAAALLAFAQRTGRMLAKPGLFTVRTNHGVTQNVALLQLAAAFPGLPEAAAWRAEAQRRLALQLAFYVSPEGVVLEHSAGYHAMGTMLLNAAHRLYRLNGLPPDERLAQAALASQRVLERLLRPDASLPPLGNTDGGIRYDRAVVPPDASAALQWLPAASAPALTGSGFYPVAGWALWWAGPGDAGASRPSGRARESQLAVSWAKHDGHGHKHADEGALTWWAAGQEWLGAVGYWPYGAALLREAYGWRSANAPHLPGEPLNSPRTAHVLASAVSPELRFVDIERRHAQGAILRRQVLQWRDATLLVLDFASAAPDGSETLWTFGPGVALRQDGASGEFRARSPRSERTLRLSLAASGALRTEILRASRQPFGGWTTLQRLPTPVDALEVRSDAGQSTVASLFQLGDATAAPGLAPLPPGLTPEQWTLHLTVGGQPLEIMRSGQRLRLLAAAPPADTGVHELALQAPAAEVEVQRAALAQAYRAAVAAYPPWRDLFDYRLTLTKWLLALALAEALALAALARWAPSIWQRQQRRIDVALVLGWAAIAAYVLAVYLKV